MGEDEWTSEQLDILDELKAGDAEHHIAKVFATNFTYVTENIRRAKHFIELLENKGHVVARPTIDEFANKFPELFSDL